MSKYLSNIRLGKKDTHLPRPQTKRWKTEAVMWNYGAILRQIFLKCQVLPKFFLFNKMADSLSIRLTDLAIPSDLGNTTEGWNR